MTNSEGTPKSNTHVNTSLSKEYAEKLIEKYGHTELHSTVEDDMDDFGPGPTMEQLEEEHRAMQEVPDDELDELEYYGRYGYTRSVPVCDDPDCPCDRN